MSDKLVLPILTFLLITVLVACKNRSHVNEVELAGYTLGQSISDIKDCTADDPYKFRDGIQYYCELKNPEQTIDGQHIDKMLLVFGSDKKLKKVNIGIYGNENVLEVLENKYGKLKKVINSTSDYYFRKDSINISYQKTYTNPGEHIVTNRNSKDNIRYHQISMHIW